MAEKSIDPMAFWQKIMGEMEKGLNSYANQAMTSPEFSKVMNQTGGITAGAQKQFVELMEKYLLTVNLPSRTQMVGIAERLQTIETQLNDVKMLLQQMQRSAGVPEASQSGVPRPPRTKRPPEPSSGERT
jgi:SMC interacting uncharacterized protein involved in chromosome segregation